MGLFDKIKSVVNKVANNTIDRYNVDTKESREHQVRSDYEFSKMARTAQDQKWKELDNYYHNKHKTSMISAMMEAEGQIPIAMPTLTDAFIHVESQIDPIIPSFQFRGRDADLDAQKAKAREDVVNFIIYNNRLERLNVENERYLNKLGNAFWKVSWDMNVKGPGFRGDIIIGNPAPSNIFPDPSAYDIDDAEYIIYAYRVHRRKARRLWGNVLDEISSSASHSDTEIFDDRNRQIDDETVQVIEYWYKDEEGDVACSIQVENKEVQFIPKFWEKTRHSGNQRFPFIKYSKIPLEQSFWDKSEIEAIKDLIDASDLEFMHSLLNSMFMGHDIMLYEEGAIKEGYEIKNVPGEQIPMNKNALDKVRRLGGISNNSAAIQMLEFIRGKIEETTGNSVRTDGIEPTRVTTASGIAQLNERSDRRKNLKKYDRLKAFEELYTLLDWMSLEFYDDNRQVIVRGKKKEEEDKAFIFNSDRLMMTGPDGATWYPSIDCEVTAGDGINKSKSFTMEVMSELIGMNITPQNLPIVEALIEFLELPNAEELITKLREGLAAMMQPGMPLGPQIPPQNNPQQEVNGGQPDIIDQAIESMTPEEFNIFKSQPQQKQAEIIQSIIGSQQGGVQ